MQQSESATAHPARKTAYVLKVYPRFSETFIVTEILAREAAGESLEVFALRPTTDTRFHPEIARVQAPVTFLPKPYKLSDAWALFADATATIPGFARRYAELLPELATYDAVRRGVGVARLPISLVGHDIAHEIVEVLPGSISRKRGSWRDYSWSAKPSGEQFPRWVAAQ